MQYTLRNVSKQLDQALRKTAAEQRKSLNQVAIEALERGSGLSQEPSRYRDLSDLTKSWAEDPKSEKAFEEQRTIDSALWD